MDFSSTVNRYYWLNRLVEYRKSHLNEQELFKFNLYFDRFEKLEIGIKAFIYAHNWYEVFQFSVGDVEAPYDWTPTLVVRGINGVTHDAIDLIKSAFKDLYCDVHVDRKQNMMEFAI